MHRYLTTNNYVRQVFGTKVYKLSLSASTTCPNRDGKISTGGCTFCSAGGSGDFATSALLPIAKQIEQAKQLVGFKANGLPYIAYFQSFTGTYGDLRHLEEIYQEAISYPEIVGISIATRPDCLDEDAMAMLERLAKIKPLWVELGLQTIHEKTAQNINRGYPLSVYNEAVEKLVKINAHRITHVILGLPGESKNEMLETVKYVGQRTDGIKLQLLHVLENTDLAKDYLAGKFQVLDQEDYYHLLADCVETLPESCIIHRLTGDGPKKQLLAPLWSANKKQVLANIQKVFNARNICPI